jgi:hypothetical protein
MIGSFSLDGGGRRNVTDRGETLAPVGRVGARSSPFWDTAAAQIAAFGDTIVRQNVAPVAGSYYAGSVPQASNLGQSLAAAGSAFGYGLGQQVGSALTEFVASDEGKAFLGKLISAGARAIGGFLGAASGVGVGATVAGSAAGGAAAVAGTAAATTGAATVGGVAATAEGLAELALPLLA